MYDIILAFITSFALTFVAIPSIISISRKKRLFDEPGERRSHTVSTPSLGGIGIFAGVLFSIIMWTPFQYFGDLQYILCAFIIIFLIGAKDDIDPISPTKKFAGEFFAAGILVFKANVTLTSFYGVLDIGDLHPIVSAVFSVILIVLIINAFNLIDGINGLSASTGILISTVFGLWFFKVDAIELSIVSFALTGALVAFLRYNITPAKIFMGDTGALLLGLVCSILSIEFIELHRVLEDSSFGFDAPVAVAVAILIIPLFDTIRVFATRIFNGHSPFHPDRTHIHHLLIDAGYSHMKATGILVLTNTSIIAIAFFLQGLGNFYLLIIVLFVAFVLSIMLYRYSSQKQKF